MLELPEAVTLAHQLEEAVVGQRVARCIAAHSPHGFAFYTQEPPAYSQALAGQRIREAVSRGGHAELIFEDGTRLSLHDGVNLRLLGADAPPPAKHQLLIALEDGRALVATVQMYGGMALFAPGERGNFYDTVADQKPSPLSDDFDRAHFQGMVREAKPKLSAKALLATEQRIPGLGNGCAQDILFNAGVNPQSHIGALSSGELEALFDSVKKTLFDMTRLGGRDTEKDLYGSAGGYRTRLSAKTRALPCPQCGGEIVRRAFLGGNVYFCPQCQPVVKA